MRLFGMIIPQTYFAQFPRDESTQLLSDLVPYVAQIIHGQP